MGPSAVAVVMCACRDVGGLFPWVEGVSRLGGLLVLVVSYFSYFDFVFFAYCLCDDFIVYITRAIPYL